MKNCISCTEQMEETVRVCEKCGFDQDSYSAQPHQLTPGTMLRGRYFVGKVMGEGGFGITYVGRDTVLDRKVAIKEFYMSGYVTRNSAVALTVVPNQGKTEELVASNRKKFITEARALAKFTKEMGVVDVLDFFEENETAYIVMEFIQGITLKEHVNNDGILSEAEAYRLIKPVLDSLENIHKSGLIHRDISPDNIMIADDGMVKLLDFGAARDVSGDDTKSLSVILKPGYAPEEQYRSKGKQGPWTDVYALCATLYYCISGVIPDNSMERLYEDVLDPLCIAAPGCSKAFSDAIAKGMAVRLKDRLQNVGELKNALEEALSAPREEYHGDNETVYVGKDVESKVKKVPDRSEETEYIGKGAERTEPKQPEEDSETVFLDNHSDTVVHREQEEISRESGHEPDRVPDHEPGRVPDREPDKKNGTKKIFIIAGCTLAALILIFIIIGSLGKSKPESDTVAAEQNEEIQDTSEDEAQEVTEEDEALKATEEEAAKKAAEEEAKKAEEEAKKAEEEAAKKAAEEEEAKKAEEEANRRPDCLIDSAISTVEFIYAPGARTPSDVNASYRPSDTPDEQHVEAEPMQFGHPLWTYPLTLAKWQESGENAIEMTTMIDPGFEFVNLGVCREGEENYSSFIYVDVVNDTEEAIPLSDCILCGATAVADSIGNDTFSLYSREQFINISFDSSEDDVINIKRHGGSKKYAGEVILDYDEDYGVSALAKYDNYDFKLQVYGGSNGLPIECIRITTQMNNKSIKD